MRYERVAETERTTFYGPPEDLTDAEALEVIQQMELAMSSDRPASWRMKLRGGNTIVLPVERIYFLELAPMSTPVTDHNG